jgi:hypothetical protein
MRRIAFLLFIIFYGCNHQQTETVQIHLSKNLYFNWNNSSGEIVKDSLYYELSKKFNENAFVFIDLVTNTSETKAISCQNGRHLLIGDLSFVIIDRFSQLPLVEILNTQTDVYNKDCRIPDGYLEAISRNRKEIKKRLQLYFFKNIDKKSYR